MGECRDRQRKRYYLLRFGHSTKILHKEVSITNKKAIIINGIIVGLLTGFVVMSIIFYYLIPVAESAINYLQQLIEELLKLFPRR